MGQFFERGGAPRGARFSAEALGRRRRLPPAAARDGGDAPLDPSSLSASPHHDTRDSARSLIAPYTHRHTLTHSVPRRRRPNRTHSRLNTRSPPQKTNPPVAPKTPSSKARWPCARAAAPPGARRTSRRSRTLRTRAASARTTSSSCARTSATRTCRRSGRCTRARAGRRARAARARAAWPWTTPGRARGASTR